VGDALCGIVHHHRKLVGKTPIGTLQHKITDRSRYFRFIHPQPPCAPDRRMRFGMGLVQSTGLIRQTFARAMARVNPLTGN